MKRVCHLSSVHTRRDIRIYLKECHSLASVGYETVFVVADGKGDDHEEAVQIIDAGSPVKNRLGRITISACKVVIKARKLRSDLYHIHDPELVPYASYLKQNGARVVYDAHEDLKRQLLSKPYLKKNMAHILSFLVKLVEGVMLSPFDALITATPSILNNLPSGLKSKAVVVANYPWINELSQKCNNTKREPLVCFVGGITKIRGLKTMVNAVEGTHVRLALAGEFESESLRNEMVILPGWKNVEVLGFLDRGSVAKLMERASAGLLVFYPVLNHIEAQPNKLFEYMSASLPVIASDFPLWRRIVEGNQCGICVDPMDEDAVRRAIETILADKGAAKKMGENGRKAIEREYNWEAEQVKLFTLYKRLLS